MNAEVVTIATETTPLDGLLYRPEGEIRGVVQLFHGNTMNFYVGPPRFLPPHLTARGFACLAYNRRGHDVLSNRDSRLLEGGAYQTIEEAVTDNRLASDWLRARGHEPPILVGHSNGGMLAVRHAADHPETPAMVLLSAHRGGNQILRLMAENGLMAADRYDEITATALRLVEEGRHRELLLVPGWWYVISAGTYVEYLQHCPDILALAPSVSCPTLFLRGAAEPPEMYPAEDFDRRAAGSVDVEVVEGCGHYYLGCEARIAERVAAWLDRTV